MTEFNPSIFVAKREVLLPFDPDADEILAVTELKQHSDQLTIGPAVVMAKLLMINLHFTLEFTPYDDDSGGEVHLLGSEGVPVLSQMEDSQTGRPMTRLSADGFVIHADQQSLVVVGDQSGKADFQIYAGFCSTSEVETLEPEQTNYTRVNLEGNLPWLKKLRNNNS